MFKFIDKSKSLQQLIPLALTVVILGALTLFLHGYISLLNLFPAKEKVLLLVRPVDIFVGLTIYLKTSIDFAIFMGRLMSTNPGWRNRIALEIGTAVGNAAGTLLVIALWVAFKEIELLLALMVFLASLVLFELAHGGLEHIANWEGAGKIKHAIFITLHRFLELY